ncbi:hypothetical protein ACJJTC_008170 [Scirpophaga incertulas]
MADQKETKELETVIAAFEKHFKPKKNIVYERLTFHKLSLGNETLSEFLIIIKNAANSCEFKEKEEMIRDKFILELKDDSLKNRLLEEGSNLTLTKTEELTKIYEKRIQDRDIDIVYGGEKNSNKTKFM